MEPPRCYVDLSAMCRPVRLSFALLAAAALSGASDAQDQSPMAASEPALATPTAPAPKPKRDRVVSDSLASALAASMPKYSPPPKPKPEDENVDLRETDKPRNGIIRLPKYTVRERKPPVFRERDVYTNEGFAELAKRRYLTPTYRLLNGLYIPLFTSSPEQHALAMYAEDERLNNISDLHDSAKTVSQADPNDGAYIKRVTDQTYMRTSDFGYERRAP